MGQVGRKMRRVGAADGYTAGGYAHWCPACNSMHAFSTDGPNSNGARWQWNGDADNPSFTPSMLITINPKTSPHYDREHPTEVCHYYLTNGAIQYLADSTHGLKNQRIILPELPPHLRDKP